MPHIVCAALDIGTQFVFTCPSASRGSWARQQVRACLTMVIPVQGGGGGKFAPMAQKEKAPPAADDGGDDSGSASGAGSAGLVSSG